MEHSIEIPCPSCHDPMKIHALRCGACDITVSGTFATNEFAQLGSEDLQFLRVFLHAEGRIREMEGPLGLSYPTIRTRLAALKEKIFAGVSPEAPPKKASAPGTTAEALSRLESGELDFEDALKIVKKKKR